MTIALLTLFLLHHPFTAEFDIHKPITIAGTLTKVEWVNPHGWSYVDAPDANGTVKNWAIEFGSTASLLRRGLRKTDFPPGATVTVKDPPDGEIPYLPWARAKQQDIQAHIDYSRSPEYIDPQARCLPLGPIRSKFWRAFRIVQYPGYVVFLHNSNQTHQIIPLDGRGPLRDDIALWMGDARGRWDGNPLVVEIRNNNSKSRLSNVGDFASEQLRIVEPTPFTTPGPCATRRH